MIEIAIYIVGFLIGFVGYMTIFLVRGYREGWVKVVKK